MNLVDYKLFHVDLDNIFNHDVETVLVCNTDIREIHSSKMSLIISSREKFTFVLEANNHGFINYYLFEDVSFHYYNYVPVSGQTIYRLTNRFSDVTEKYKRIIKINDLISEQNDTN